MTADGNGSEGDQVRQRPFGWWSRLREHWWARWGIDLFLIGAVVFGVSTWQASCGPAVGTSLPAMELKRLGGGSADLYDDEGTTLIYVWAPWCGVCDVVGPNAARAGDWTGASVRAVAFDWKTPDGVRRKAADHGLSDRVLLGDQNARRVLEPSSFPTFLVVGPDGEIRYRWVGYTTTVGLVLRLFL